MCAVNLELCLFYVAAVTAARRIFHPGYERLSRLQTVISEVISQRLADKLALRKTRSQAVARMADRTAKNCSGHVT